MDGSGPGGRETKTSGWVQQHIVKSICEGGAIGGDGKDEEGSACLGSGGLRRWDWTY